MQFNNLLALLAGPALVLATLDKALSNTKGKYPAKTNCTVGRVSKDIQAAECAYNTRLHKHQTFAVFQTDHAHDKSHGAPYGTCKAYSCTPPTSSEMVVGGEDYWTFFWTEDGEESGEGTTCIKSPDDGTCGCENSDGTFIAGGDSCV